MKSNSPILVAIKCLTYNHGPYIRQCLEGFIMQKTDFRFVAIVHDDASTDDTADVIREYAEKYPDIIIPLYETENQHSKGGTVLLKIINDALFSTGCRYIAWCEGDDFWTDPLKLQKQVDILEAHPEYSLCCSNVKRMIHSTGEEWCRIYKNRIITLNELMYQRNRIAALSVLMRTDLAREYYRLNESMPDWPMGDMPAWIWMASKGDIYKLPDVTATYRILNESASHSADNNRKFFFRLAQYDIRLYFCNMLKKISLPIWIERDFFIIKDVLRNRKAHSDKLGYLFRTRWSIKA